MADHSKIEWTDATWNPVTGCSVVSPGCTNCYAMKLAGTRLKHHESRAGLTRDTKAGPVWTGEVRFNEAWLTQPLQWKRPRMVFVCAHGDLFHEDVPDAWIDQVFAVMALSPQHTFQVLTKRAKRMLAYLGTPGEGRRQRHHAILGDASSLRPDADLARLSPVGADRRNIWLGFSAEDQDRYDERSEYVLEIGWPGPIFVSIEPMLGPIDMRFTWDHCDLCGGTGKLGRWPNGQCHVCRGRGRVLINGKSRRDGYRRIDWVIVGGENGPRPMLAEWAQSIRDQCAAADTPFFFKQWGSYLPAGQAMADGRIWAPRGGPNLHAVKAMTGRLLDGVEHNAMPRSA